MLHVICATAALVLAPFDPPPQETHLSLLELHEFPLTGDDASDFDPVIFKGDVAFITNRLGAGALFLVDQLAFETPLVTLPSVQATPDIDGSRIVYVDNQFGDRDINLYDLEVMDWSFLVSDGADDFAPAISGDDVVFVSDRTGADEIWHVDLNTLDLTRLTTDGEDLFRNSPDVEDGLVAWEQFNWRGFSNDIWAMDLSNGTPFLVAGGPGLKTNAKVDEGRILYSNDADLRLFDVASGQTLVLTDDPHIQSNARIDGDFVVWSDDRNGHYDIYLHDVATGLLFRLTDEPVDQFVGGIHGHQVVFEDERFGNLDVFRIDIDLRKLSTAFPTGSLPRSAPRTVLFRELEARGPGG